MTIERGFEVGSTILENMVDFVFLPFEISDGGISAAIQNYELPFEPWNLWELFPSFLTLFIALGKHNFPGGLKNETIFSLCFYFAFYVSSQKLPQLRLGVSSRACRLAPTKAHHKPRSELPQLRLSDWLSHLKACRFALVPYYAFSYKEAHPPEFLMVIFFLGGGSQFQP